MTQPWTFRCCCGAMFGTRATCLEEAKGHARERGWTVVQADEPATLLRSYALCSDCGPITESERLAVLVLLGSVDPRRALNDLNDKGRAIVDDVAAHIRAGDMKLARRKPSN